MSNLNVPSPIPDLPFKEPKEGCWILDVQPAVKVIQARGNELLGVKQLEERK